MATRVVVDLFERVVGSLLLVRVDGGGVGYKEVFLSEVTDELRQGDICFSWPVPRWLLTDYQTLKTQDNKTTKMQVGVHLKGAELPLVLCSHDCDLENPRERLGFLVAPLIPWPFEDMASDSSLDLIGSSDVQDGSYSYINLFPLSLPESQDESGWRVVDYSSVMSVGPPTKLAPLLRKTKRLEMTEETRALFKSKMAAFLAR
jgi:hypothetical protein